MSFSTSGAHIIVALGALLVLSTVVGVGGNVAERVSEANEAFLEDERQTLKTEFKIAQAKFLADNGVLLIKAKNVGSRVLKVSDTDFLVDGTYFGVDTLTTINYPADGKYTTSYNVSDDPDTDLWVTKESLYVRLDVSEADRLKMVVDHGVAHATPVEEESRAINSWPTFGYNATNAGHATEITGPTASSSEDWSNSTGGEVHSSPAAYTELLTALEDRLNRTVFVGSNDGTVYAYNATDGTTRWTHDVGSAVQSSPTIYRDTVYVGADDGTLYALDWIDGSVRWTFDTSGKIQTGVIVVNGTVYFGSFDQNLYAVNASTGNEEWSFNTGGEVRTTPGFGDGRVYVAGKGSKTVYGIFTNGTKDWENTTGEEVYGGLTYRDGEVYFGSASGFAYAFDADDGSEIWRYDAGGNGIKTSPAVTGSTVYLGDDGGTMHAIRRSDGSGDWTTDVGSVKIQSSPAVVSDTVYFGAHDGNVYALHRTGNLTASAGDKRWTFENPSGEIHSSPAILNGTVYIGSNDGSVYAIEES